MPSSGDSGNGDPALNLTESEEDGVVPVGGIALITPIENTQLIEKSRRSKRTIP
jgi:hypothetical protein